MPRKLITIIGRARQDSGGNYIPTNYDFTPYGGKVIPTTYFGDALDQHVKSDELIILGTTASMWNNLFPELELSEEYKELLRVLEKRIKEDCVEAELLNNLAQAASAKRGKSIRCELIPYGRDEVEQIAIINQLLGYFKKGDCAYFIVCACDYFNDFCSAKRKIF